MNHRKIYLKIIRNALASDRKRCKGIYYEAHHILPKSLFPNWSKRKSNIVLLTAREHFFCHQLLTKIYPSFQMTLALWLMSNDYHHNFLSSKEYEKLKQKFSQAQSIDRKGRISPMEGKVHLDETKNQISDSVKNYWKNNTRIPWNKNTTKNKYKILGTQKPNSEAARELKRSLTRKTQGNIIQCVETGNIFYSYGALLETLNNFSSTTLKRYINTGKPVNNLHYIILQHKPRKLN